MIATSFVSTLIGDVIAGKTQDGFRPEGFIAFWITNIDFQLVKVSAEEAAVVRTVVNNILHKSKS